MVPATWVPWSLVVGYQPVAEVSGRPASVQLTESATSMLAARSGWSGSMPLSRTPTTTLRLPSVISWAWSALIIFMSHCSASRGSSRPAGGRARLPTVAVDVLLGALLVAGRAAAPRGAGASGVPSETATVRVAPTDSTALPPSATTSARNVETSRSARRRRRSAARTARRRRPRPRRPARRTGSGRGWRAGVDDVAHEQAVGGGDRDGRRGRLLGRGCGRCAAEDGGREQGRRGEGDSQPTRGEPVHACSRGVGIHGRDKGGDVALCPDPRGRPHPR